MPREHAQAWPTMLRWWEWHRERRGGEQIQTRGRWSGRIQTLLTWKTKQVWGSTLPAHAPRGRYKGWVMPTSSVLLSDGRVRSFPSWRWGGPVSGPGKPVCCRGGKAGSPRTTGALWNPPAAVHQSWVSYTLLRKQKKTDFSTPLP